MLYSYLRYTDRLLDVFFLLLTVILSELQEEKIELQNNHPKLCGNCAFLQKVLKRFYVRDITLLTAYPPSYVIFCRLFCQPTHISVLYSSDALVEWPLYRYIIMLRGNNFVNV